MTFEEYAAAAGATAVYPGRHEFGGRAYAALGLTGEAGEVAEKVKKLWRDNGELTAEVCESVAYELGDVLWYVAAMAYEIGYPLEVVAEMNVDKLRSRRDRGVLAGSGDDR